MSNSATAPVLLKYGKAFAESYGVGISLTTIIQIPYQTPLDMPSRFTDEAENLIKKNMKILDKEIKVSSSIRYAHNIAEGLIQSVKSSNANFLVMGWTGKQPRKNFHMGSTLDPVIEKASCDLVVIKPGKNDINRPIKKILCPTKGRGPHGKLVWDLVKKLALTYDAEVTILHITPNDKTGIVPDQIKEALPIEYEGMEYKVRIMQSSDPVARIESESKDYDLVVIGSSETSVFQRLLFGSKPLQIAERCTNTVMMVRKNTGIRSWFKRWFI